MTDERLAGSLSSWLRESVPPPPDAQMSAGRVMAGVETTPRLGRFWPPGRLVRAVEPAPALGAFGPEGPPPRPMPRVQAPRLKARLRSVVTPVRLLAVANVTALATGAVLVGASLMPSGGASQPAVVAPVPVITAAPSPVAEPTAVTTAAPTPTAVPAPTPWPTWAPSSRVLDWHHGGVRLEADRLQLRIGDRTFAGSGEVLTLGATQPDRARLESRWLEGGVEQRLVLELVVEEPYWWLSQAQTYDGRKAGGWITFGGLAERTRTALGESFEGDLRATSTGAQRKALRKPGTAALQLDGLRLTAFGPGTRRAPLADCHLYTGEGLPGALDSAMTPAELEASLLDTGLCFVFDHTWPVVSTLDDPRLADVDDVGLDRRCSAPSSGSVSAIEAVPVAAGQGSGSLIVVRVEDAVAPVFEPPPAGTDCPAIWPG